MGIRTHEFHPWRRMRDLGPEWTLRWSTDFPDDVYGYTDFGARVITLREGMTFEERRCSVLHEVMHAERGPLSRCHDVGEESTVERASSRLLLASVKDIADAMMWHHGDYERVASTLWCDPLTLEVRLGSFWRNEARYYRERLCDVMLTP